MTETRAWESEAVADWERRGAYRTLLGWETFTMDVAPDGAEEHEPLLVLHGFPTCSFDFRQVLGALTANRRVLLLDMIGYGLSAKPDLGLHDGHAGRRGRGLRGRDGGDEPGPAHPRHGRHGRGRAAGPAVRGEVAGRDHAAG